MFEIEDLDFKDNSDDEQIRTRKIFEDIRERAINGDKISEHEKEFFCLGVKASIKNDGKLEDYPCCENYIFKSLYLCYFRDLTGQATYYKWKYEKSENEIRCLDYVVDDKEKNEDLDRLFAITSEWKEIICKPNHSDKLLQEISTETRKELKLLGTEKKSRKVSILLQSKYIYCTALLILEEFKNDLSFVLNNQTIEIDEYSIVHILNRHFSNIVKQNPNKSYHTRDFQPKYLTKQIKNIIELIDSSGHYKKDSIKNIYFGFREKDYAIWTKEATKQERGKGNIKYNRLETFYPIEDKTELEKIRQEFTPIKINSEIYVYIRN